MLRDLINPKSIAVIGASSHTGKVGFSILKNIVDGGFGGKIFPINPDTDSIIALKCYPSVLDVKSAIDLAVIVVPAKVVPQVLIECGKKKIKSAIIISSGFSEVGEEGRKLQEQIKNIAELYHITVLGPNCLGLIDPVNKLNISFGGPLPKKKNIGIISQSGATGTAILDWAKDNGIGISRFISLGNKIDLNEVDFLEFLGEDKETRVIICYLESLTEGTKFYEVAKKVAAQKPLIVLKAGRTVQGQKAASSHTGALASDDAVIDAAFAQAGIIRAEGLEDLFDLARLFSQLERAKEEVLIITNAGGPSVITADSIAETNNLKLHELTQPEKTETKKLLPRILASNPLDLLGDATSLDFEAALKVFGSNNLYKVIIVTPQVNTDIKNIAKVIKEHKDHKTLVVLVGGGSFLQAKEILADAEIPVFNFPERAIKALNAFAVSENKIQKMHYTKGFPKVAEKVLSKCGDLTDAEIAKILAAYHVPMAESFLTVSATEAVTIAEKIGYPIAIKVTSPDILHRTEVGAVKVNINNEDELRISYQDVLKNAKKNVPKAKILGVTVYKMHSAKLEVALGAKRDPSFGPVIMFGMGGIYIEVLRDFKLGIAPISIEEAVQIIESIKLYPTLNGFRSGPVYEIEGIAKAISGLSILMEDFPAIKEIDINPLAVGLRGQGVLALDAKIIFEEERILV